MASAFDTEREPMLHVHTISEAHRLLPSSSQWNSIELDFNLLPRSSNLSDSIPSQFSKSVDFNLVISDRKYFRRFLYISAAILLFFVISVLLLRFWPRKHSHHRSSEDLTLALGQALLFFDAQKSGYFPKNSSVTFRGDSGLHDGSFNGGPAKLVGGFYDSGNNVKFSFPTAYVVTLLSWTVIEYHEKYDHVGELKHVKDIVRWGSDYLLKVFAPPSPNSDAILYSQVGSSGNETGVDNDINCWQRPEDMNYKRNVSACGITASDLAGEMVAALSAASLVFKEDKDYSRKLVVAAEKLFELATARGLRSQGTYTANEECGGQARNFYNSTSYKDELIWGGTWLFLATGTYSYLGYATNNLVSAEEEEVFSDRGIFYWNNKLIANAVLLTRLRFFHDLGNPYEDAFRISSDRTDFLMCSYVSQQHFNRTEGGLILLKPDYGAPLQYAATAAFLSKLYSDYLDLLQRSGSKSTACAFSIGQLRMFSTSQVSYILGDNPMKMSYVVGFGSSYPRQVHHRAASIPWDNRWHSCKEGNDRWRNLNASNPNNLVGAMVAGPDQNDIFMDERDKPWFTEPSISGNAGLVAALAALHDPPRKSKGSDGIRLGIDKTGIFENIHLIPLSP
ncbi:Cellulase [Bertholletia excelsa]